MGRTNDFMLIDEDIPEGPRTDSLSWAEYALGSDLEIHNCPTCMNDVLPGFFLWRPAGLKYWRCLRCLARTYHAGALYQAREIAE